MKYALNLHTPRNENFSVLHWTDTMGSEQLHMISLSGGRVYFQAQKQDPDHMEKLQYAPEHIHNPAHPLLSFRRQKVMEREYEARGKLQVSEVSPFAWHAYYEENEDSDRTLTVPKGSQVRTVRVTNGESTIKLNHPADDAIAAWLGGIKGSTTLHVLVNPLEEYVTILDIVEIGGVSMRSLPKVSRVEILRHLVGRSEPLLRSIYTLIPEGRDLRDYWYRVDGNAIAQAAFEQEKLLLSFSLDLEDGAPHYLSTPHYYLVDPATTLHCRILSSQKFESEPGSMLHRLGLYCHHTDDEVQVANAFAPVAYEPDDLVEVITYIPVNLAFGGAMEPSVAVKIVALAENQDKTSSRYVGMD